MHSKAPAVHAVASGSPYAVSSFQVTTAPVSAVYVVATCLCTNGVLLSVSGDAEDYTA
jgi:hypothetical protein